MAGTVYLVATPIGNLQDITLRALEVLRSVDLIACEDTRHTLKLLNHFRISNRLVSYHEHNERERAEELIDKLLNGESVAVVSDAGTPGISDPRVTIVKRAAEAGVEVVSIPGPVAFVSALVASGLETGSVFFGGFLPSKKGDRRRRLEELRDIGATLVFYESPHRLGRSLADCVEILGDRAAVVARELTKLHEEIARGSLSELTERFGNSDVKGEVVLMIGEREEKYVQKPSSTDGLLARVNELESEGLSSKAALKKAAKEFGLSKSEAYRIQLENKGHEI